MAALEEGVPIMRIERLTHGADGTPLDFEYLYYRGDAFQYRQRIDRNSDVGLPARAFS